MLLHRILPLAVLVAALSAPTTSYAQPTASEMREAGEAFEQGTSAFLSSDFQAAAHWFERANNLAPSPIAVVNAIRAHQRLGNEDRIARLALQLEVQFPESREYDEVGRDLVREHSGRFHRVTVECDEECAVAADGRAQPILTFFVTPGREVAVTAEFPGGTREQTVVGPAGGRSTLTFEAPPPPADEPPTITVVEERPPVPAAVFYSLVGAGVAAAGAGVAVNFINASNADDFDAAVAAGDAELTQSLYDDGQVLQKTSRALVFGGAGLAVGGAIIAGFTDFGGSDDPEEDPTISVLPVPIRGGLGLTAQGSF